MINKLENSVRVAELSPCETLDRLDIAARGTFCDIGAGTGIFSLAAADLTGAEIYAVEISSAMREVLHARNAAGRLHIAAHIAEVPDQSCGTALLCTVLHELDDIPAMLSEIRRILKPDGVLAVIEFHKRQTPFGPPPTHRMGEEDAAAQLGAGGFGVHTRWNLGENFYGLALGKTAEGRA